MEVETGNVLKMVMSIGIVMVVGLVAIVYRRIVMEPNRLRWSLRKQGISGPPPAFLLGNLLQMKVAVDAAKSDQAATGIIHHNLSPFILPFLHQWIQNHGDVFMLSLGVKTVLHVTQTNLVKEITTSTSPDLGKASQLREELAPMLGQGIIASNGATWALHKKILAPNLYLDKVKGMMTIITDSSLALVRSWNDRIETGGVDIEIGGYLRTFTGDVISKACFGQNHSQGEEIFWKIMSLEDAMSDIIMTIGIPGLRYIPTKKSKEARVLEKEIHGLILKVVKERKEVGCEAKDLLQMVIEGAENSGFSSQNEKNKFIIDNCKNIYLAGSETSAVSASWCLMLLASNPEWQTRVRAEVVQVCQGQIPTTSMLLEMKELTMVIQEALRLYSPVPLMSREALNDLKIGDIHVAKGVQVWAYVFTLHTDPEIWEPDSLEFNPQRFANGVSGACKFPHVYMPFGVGRVCIGQHLAMAELKVVISLAVANFSFSVSPNYVHSPICKQLVVPEHGVNLLVKRL